MNSKYSDAINKDTVEAFGDGRNQIGRSLSYVLIDAKQSTVVLCNITHWDSHGGYAYIIGETTPEEAGKKYPEEYYVIDLTRDRLMKYPKLAVIPRPHRAVFQQLIQQPPRKP